MTHSARARARGVTALAAAVVSLTSCSSTEDDEQPRTAAASTERTVFDDSTVHEFNVQIDTDEYQAMIETYLDTGDKEWITGTVTIDGETFTDVGLKLKGNSSLMGVTAETAPETLPWRIELDQFVED